ncbi:TPA: CDP-glycerol glycerophosphotransferase family protein [Streptococcus suis]
MKLLTTINRFLPKHKRRIVLYSNLGFRDNVKALYDYLVANDYHKTYQLVCLSNNFYSLKKEKGIVYTNIYIGLFYFLFSKYFFYSFGKYPIKPSPKQTVVNLWHGMPLKKIGNLEDHLKEKDFNYFTHLVSSSDFFTPIMKKAFHATDDQIIKVGNVRNDELFKLEKKRKIIWMPTYRDVVNLEEQEILFTLDEGDLTRLNALLDQHDYTLYIKLHPLEKRPLSITKECKRIQLLSDQDLSDQAISLYEFLGETAALITDYSSVFVDYYLLNRPIAFTIDDLKKYNTDRGFVVENIEDLMAGAKILTKEDLLDFFQDTVNGVDRYQVKREEINHLLNDIQGNFCQHLLERISL